MRIIAFPVEKMTLRSGRREGRKRPGTTGKPAASHISQAGNRMQGLSMSSVLSFRSYKVPVIESQFFQSTSKANEEFAASDLARSGLTMDDMEVSAPPMLPLKEGAQAGYIIPYYGLTGRPIVDSGGFSVMFRTRLKYPEFSKEQRYTQPSKEQLAKYELPSYIPYIHPLTLSLEGDTLVCCEGEKKTASVLKYIRMPAFGIGGCQMWRDPSGRGGIHPWIRELARQRDIKKILIIPDGDLFRYDICTAYGTFAHTLLGEGYEVKIANPAGKIDDLIISWGSSSQACFRDLPTVSLEDLVQSPASLARRFNLSFKQDNKERVIVHQNTSNVMILLQEYDAFPKIWRDTDTNRIMVGEEIAEPGRTEMEIANYFQHNLGMEKISNKMITQCIEAMAKKNSRSPFLEYIQSQTWDGKPRIDSWMIDHWGVEDSKYAREISSKWLVSAVARMIKPGTKIDWMLIVVGPQGTGKTTMPSIFFKGLSRNLYGEHDNKDLHMLLHSGLCVGFDELDSFGKRESSNLKAMITTNEDAFRPPYGASVEIFPRRFTLYGCGNRYEFLQHDPSGYRRYAVLEVSRLLDFARLEGERDQLWAEAYHRYQTDGTRFWEVENASAFAEKYVAPNPIQDMIVNIIESWKVSKVGTNLKDGKIYFTMIDLMQALDMGKDFRNSGLTRELAASLRGIGAVSYNGTMPVGRYRGRYYSVDA